ncbi:class II fructose-bisphosphate aldolase [Oceanivirga salmonicida]|uniref:class II fructose-bisphosphate aldolase n=1 Tax=Oceanivirga salmonicida TaxID=1769291 RepID=UPI00082A27A1|nr:class II fructose-bisphosphate aldolase [Oceanivirga salmonicida]
MYTNLNKVLTEAQKFKYTVGAFNMHCLEMLPSMIYAAYEMGTPIIIQTSVGTAKYIGYKNIVSICKNMGDELMVDVVLHLDHAKNFCDIKEAIDAGYTSVMFDGSALSFKENIIRTRRVVDYAHKFNVTVEGEIGTIGGTEEGISVKEEDKVYTNPKDVINFIEKTDIDALAIAIGTNHGQYRSKTSLNFELLKEINSITDIPLVIHGGTGVKNEDIPMLIKYGIRKFNVGTELIVAWTSVAIEKFKNTKLNESLRHNVIPCNESVKKVIKDKLKLFCDMK